MPAEVRFHGLLDARPENGSQPQRQQAYPRALATLPGFDIHYRTFRLLVDGLKGEYEQAVGVSNDADFTGPMRYVKDGLGLGLPWSTLMLGTPALGDPGKSHDLRQASLEESSQAEPASRRLRMGSDTMTKPAGW